MAAEDHKAPIGIRAPRDLADWIKRQAEENHRSVSAQVVHLLEQKRREANESMPA